MTAIYCPICQRSISPANLEEAETGEHDGYIYVHDDIPHDDHDLNAIEAGIQ